MAEKILIVGAVAAGPKSACRARRLLPDAEITLIDQDSLISYGGCGIPYYISGDVTDEKELRATSFHMVRDERFFTEAKGLNVLIQTRAKAIDREKRLLHVEDVNTGKSSSLSYDKLVLATGSSPNSLNIPGKELEGIFTISSLHKAIEIKESLARGKVEKAVVIGGGAIGIEIAEALADLWEIDTTIVEFMPQLLPGIVPKAISLMVKQHLGEHDVKVHTSEYAKEFIGNSDGRVKQVVTNKREIEADLVVVSFGVRPRGELAEASGLLVSPDGGIVVDKRMQTSDPYIYAAGDCVETYNLITGKKAFAPFGSIANRQGRVVADNLAGIPSRFEGVVGSFIMKVFDICVGATGISSERAISEGFDAVDALTTQSDRAHFYPTYDLMFLNMVADKKTKRVLGLQGVGAMGDGLMARINAAASLLQRGQPVISDFSDLELSYAPPFSTAVDILNATANVADNLISGRLEQVSIDDFVSWMDGKEEAAGVDWVALDLRHSREAAPLEEKFPERWLAMPYDEVRALYGELPRDTTLILICNSGTRSYEIQCFLRSVNVLNTLVLPGGLNVLKRLGLSWLE